MLTAPTAATTTARAPTPYRPRPRRPRAVVPCPEAAPFLARFTVVKTRWQQATAQELALIAFRQRAGCGLGPRAILASIARYVAAGGPEWQRDDWIWAGQMEAALDEEPAAALALARQCARGDEP